MFSFSARPAYAPSPSEPSAAECAHHVFLSSGVAGVLPSEAICTAKVSRRSSPQRGWGTWLACWVTMAGLMLGGAGKMKAQTAHFGSQITPFSASFNLPSDVKVDGSGNVFIADSGNNRVLKETPSAGTYTQSTVGSGLSAPAGLAVDGSGNLYIADEGNNRVVKETPSAGTYTQTTVASGLNGPLGVGTDGSGNVYVADTGNNRVVKETLSGGTYGQTILFSNGLNTPNDVKVDGSGNVYIADTGNNRVLKETLSGGTYTQSLVGSSLSSASGLSLDASDNVYIADTGNARVLKETLSGGTYTQSQVGSGLSGPTGVATDGSGDVFIADNGSNRVVEVTVAPPSFGAVPVGSTGGKQTETFTFDTGGSISAPVVLTQGATGLDFKDAGTGSCTTNGTSHTYAAGDSCTVDVTFSPKFAGARNGVVQLATSSGTVVVTAYLEGTGTGPQVNFLPGTESTVASSTTVTQPQGVAVDGSGNVYIADYSNKLVLKMTLSGGSYTPSTLLSSGGGLGTPEMVAVDAAGNVYIADSANNRILKETLSGGSYVLSTVASSTPDGLNSPSGVAVDGSGNVYVADTDNNRILKETLADGAYVQTTVPTSTLSTPFGVAVDASGNIYLTDTNHNRVLKETLSGGSYSESTVVSTGLDFPVAVEVDGNGNLYIADYNNNRVLKETVSGSSYVESTVSTSTLLHPFGVAVDGAGNVYLSDVGNQRVLKEDLANAPSLGFASTDVGSTSSDSPQTVTLVNIGNAALSLPIPPGGNNPSISTNFTLSSIGSQACPLIASTSSEPGALAAGETCNLPVSFAPTEAGSISGALVLTDTNLNANPSTTQTINLSGTATNPAPTATQAIASMALTRNHAATAFTPVTGSGGTAPLSYSVAPALPAGLSFSSTTGAVTGTPTAASAASTYTVTVTDSHGATATATFSLTVNAAVTATQAVASTALTQNRAATAFAPVTGSGGTGSLTYSVAPALPAGLSFSSTTGAITGTPTAASVAGTYTVTVTDTNGATATATFNLTVNTAVTATQAVASTTLTQNRAATAFTPVMGSGGTGSLTYSVAPALPTGLSFSSTTGAIAGTAALARAAGTYTVTVTDANGATATNTFSLTVNVAVTATQAIASTVATQNHTVTAFTPVTGGGGTAPLSYSVSPALPTGLSFSSTTGVITGTPTAAITASSYTVTVTDANGATAANTFSLTVNAAVTATQAIASTTLTVNHAATGFTPVTGGRGTGSLTYSVAPALPAGLSFSSTTGAVTGTPAVASTSTSYTVTVTDANGATATATFSLTVNVAVTATQAIGSTAVTQNHTVTPFTPVTGGGGTAPLSYSISPALPAGLSLNSATGAVRGTPAVTSRSTTYTVTVTDANGATAAATFSLTVNAAVTATQAIASTTLTQNHAATAFTPVTGGGGTGSLTYSVTPALPTGLSFSSTTAAITGTPAVTSPAASYTVTVTDANGATATATFSLTVNAAVTATQAIASTTLTQNHAATAFTPVTGGGGTGLLTYSVTPALPTGLSFSSTTAAITGTPAAVRAAATYTVTVTDANGATATATFNLTVNAAVTATQAVASTVVTQNHTIAVFTPVTGGGGTGSLSYSVSPALPAGLSFSSVTGAVTGTPTAASPASSYTVTVTDANGATATATFSLTVNPAVTATQAVASTSLTVNRAATAFTPVTGGSGTGSLTYSVSPALPAGLSFNSTTGAVTGTPTAASPASSYTVTVTDANGATATATFSLTVNATVTATQAIASTTLTVNHAVTAFTPVTGGGGTGSLTYSVTPALPTGLSFSLTTGAVTGTPPAVKAAATYTVTVTDANGAKAAATFSLAVNTQATTIVTTPTAISIVYGQPVTLNAAISPSSSGGFAPTGTVTFYDGTPVVATVTVANAAASSTVNLPAVGTHSYAAQYGGDANFAASAQTAATAAVTVGKAAATLTGPAAATQVLYGRSGSIPVAITGQYSGAGIAAPSGLVSYTILNSAGAAVSTGSLTIASGAVTVPVAGNLQPGNYTVSVTYGGDTNYAASATAASYSLQVGQIQPVVAITAPGSLTYGTALGISATATYNHSTVAGSFTFTATPAGGIASPVTAATVLPAGSYTLRANFMPADTTTYVTATRTVSLTVHQAATVAGIATNMIPSLLQNAVTFTATVSSQAGRPTGTVSFLDGTTPLGSGTLSGGVATFTTSSLAAGSHSITGVYSGDANFMATTSAAIVQPVIDFNLNSGGGGSQTVLPGGAATYTIAIVPTAGTMLPLATVLTVTGLPAGATAALTAPSWSQTTGTSWLLPANTQLGNVALIFQVPSATAKLGEKDAPMHRLPLVFWGVLLLPFGGALRRGGKRLGRTISLLLLLTAGAASVTGMMGCGSANGFLGQQQKAYTVTVTVTTGTLSHSTNLTLTVE
jgi:sugar lactone lactonase YvrE